MAAVVLDLEPGDLVIVPTITFMASANAARMVGAEVLFADIDPETGLMGPRELEAALTNVSPDRVKAVIPVHLAGQTADMEGIAEVCRARGIRIVEDACHAIATTAMDASSRPWPVGSCRSSDMTVFSFHPVKTITTGEGGAITTNDSVLADRLRLVRSHNIVRDPDAFENRDMSTDADGGVSPWYHEMPDVGFNYRCSDIHCALGLSQLGKLDQFAARRRALAARYDEALVGLAPIVRPLARVPGCDPVLHLYVVLIDFPTLGMDRSALMRALKTRGVGTQVHYIPVHRQPYYRKRYGDLSLPGAESYYARCLSLPLFPDMQEDEVDRVVGDIRDMIRT